MSIRSYSRQGTVTIKGTRAKDIKENLVKAVENQGKLNSNRGAEDGDINVLDEIKDEIDGTPVRQTTNQADGTIIQVLKRLMEKFERSIESELNPLSSEVNNLRSEYEMIARLNSELDILKYKEPCSCSMEMMEDLKRIIGDLKVKNKALKERKKGI